MAHTKYHRKAAKKVMAVGSRAQVWHGTARRTSGGLTKSDLMMSKGRIVSKKKHHAAKKENRLKKHGYGPASPRTLASMRMKTRKYKKKQRGGDGYNVNYSLSPATVNWKGLNETASNGITYYKPSGSVGVQMEAGMTS
jgi:DVNP family